MADREQTRRDAVRKTAVDVSAALHDLAESTGRVIDTLLLTLEQAEREQDAEEARAKWLAQVVKEGERTEGELKDRLAKVPALVEALRYYAKTKDSRGAVARQALIEMGEL